MVNQYYQLEIILLDLFVHTNYLEININFFNIYKNYLNVMFLYYISNIIKFKYVENILIQFCIYNLNLKFGISTFKN